MEFFIFAESKKGIDKDRKSKKKIVKERTLMSEKFKNWEGYKLSKTVKVPFENGVVNFHSSKRKKI